MSTIPAEATVEDTHRAVSDGGAVLLDVREPWEHEQQRIPGAVLIPMRDVPKRLDEIPDDRDVYVHCKMGGRSARVVDFLRSRGRTRVSNVAGGLDAWVAAGLPVE